MSINIVDTNNFAFYMASGVISQGIDNVEDYVKMNAIYLLSGAFLNNEKQKSAKYLFVGDSKPYWRYDKLKELGVIYKGKRGSGDERYSAVLPLILTCLEKCLAKQEIYVYYKEGYEADDIAATFVSNCATLHTPINLITSDQDWIPLIGVNGLTTWNSTLITNNRIITASNCMSFFNNHKTYNGSKAKKAFPKTSILDIWKFKATFGDSSDNIPSDKTGSMKYLPFIDLMNPLPEYDLKQQPEVVKDIKSYVSKEFPQVTHDKFIGNRRLPFTLALNKLE
jgi:5'-3' exonuclease